jgi:hydrogenase maturation protein HypF
LITRKRFILTGRVQGIGFRPAVYRLAKALTLAGFVYNDTKGVTIEVQGTTERIEEFTERLKSGKDLSVLTDVQTVHVEDVEIVTGEIGFSILKSDVTGTPISQVTADIAVCDDCLREMRDKNDFRYRYPFINCTNCGPRYSIVKTIPYDRLNTTMSVFKMCDKCAAQYKDVNDRRFHAQPVACPICGPKITLCDNKGRVIEQDGDEAIAQTAQMLLAGKIMVIKGVGGFHLAVNALDNDAVKRLRQRKKRDAKPFAMMTDSIDKIRKYAVVDELAERILKSPEAPIVLLPKRPDCGIAPSVAEGVNTFGFMLCYAPLHYLLFDEGLDVLVMTSGNISDEPLICKNDQALEKLGEVTDAFLMHDREIYRQVDDSIVHFIDGQAVLLRRARGYVPTPFCNTAFQAVKPRAGCPCYDVFAAGSDLKNTFCCVKANQVIVSEHIGDMEDASVYHHYIDSVEHLGQLFGVEPKVIVCDLHPGYFSTQYAQSWHGLPARANTAKMAVPQIIKVQHHWAHIASVLAEYGLDEKVIGLECDGTGYGTDGAVWGCECLIADLEGFERFGHLMYYPLAGGDLAAKEAIRPTLALLNQTFEDRFELSDFSWLLDRIEPNIEKQKLILQQISKRINTVNTSSLGRVFDAVAATVGLGSYNNFEAQLPMALEASIIKGIDECYDVEITEPVARTSSPCKTWPGWPCHAKLLDLRPMFRQIITDLQDETPVGDISAKFHNTLAAGLLALAQKARQQTNLNKVALSGGVFCNRYLTNRLVALLKKNGFTVLFNRFVPSNDGGISLGQAAIAAKKSKQN